MTEKKVLPIDDPSFAPEHFLPGSLSDEIRIDQLIVALLSTFCRDEVAAGVDPLRAGAWARGADYFLRDFVVDHCRNNLFFLPAGQVRHFAGNWYIIKTVEPNRAELGEILEGVEAFYRYCHEHGKVTKKSYEEIAAACSDLDYYQKRINAFWEISDDGYQSWDATCPLQKITS
jgi:hypothetical protein